MIRVKRYSVEHRKTCSASDIMEHICGIEFQKVILDSSLMSMSLIARRPHVVIDEGVQQWRGCRQ